MNTQGTTSDLNSPPLPDLPARADLVILSDQKQSVSFEDEWYEVVDSDHFWMEWRKRAFFAQLKHIKCSLEQPWHVLEVGGGHGALRKQVESAGHWTIDISEINPPAITKCESGKGRVLYYDVLDRHQELVGTYDAVILFDVLEHIADSRSFLTAVTAHIRPGGMLFVNVPALQCFHSAYDEVLGHYRRYDRQSLVAEIDTEALEVVDVRYWGLTLLPALVARSILFGNRPVPENRRAKIASQGCTPPHSIFDWLFRLLMRMETAACSRPPLGTSILMACRRR